MIHIQNKHILLLAFLFLFIGFITIGDITGNSIFGIFSVFNSATRWIKVSSFTSICIDSDKGIDYYTSGYVDYKNKRYYDYCAEYGKSVVERYCKFWNNKTGYIQASQKYTCPNGCSNRTCNPLCGDKICQASESCSTCSVDCGTCVEICTNECSINGTKQCYNSNYYQICGNYDIDTCLEWSNSISCGSGQTCVNGNCICAPNCLNKTCGNDGCGGSCGTCSIGSYCSNGNCVLNQTCTPATCSSLGKQCGSWSDGCGVTLNCGTCSSGYTCSNGACIISQNQTCTPSCVGKICGSDGCGGSCGTCSQQGQTCNSNGQCVLNGIVCATCSTLRFNCGTWSDRCGNTLNCGDTCPSGFICYAGRCTDLSICDDSDGGQNYYVKGTINYNYGASFSTDFCLDGTTLHEWWCVDITIHQINYICPNGCSNGQCVVGQTNQTNSTI
ncbi:MAG: hypothetical protein V1815_01215 [Candidatus Woesearchaeota archaeon]